MNNKKDRVKKNTDKLNKRKLFTYSPSKLKNAITAIRNGSSILSASKTFNVPRTTLRHKLKGDSSMTSGRVGPESILGPRIEEILVNWLLDTCRMGFPVNKEGLLYSVKQLIDAEAIKTPFKDNVPGRKWFDSFMKRHPQLSKKKAEYLSKSRACATEEFIRRWFSEVKLLLSDYKEVLNDPKRIFNMDETGMCPTSTRAIVIAERGKSAYYVSSSSNKENITTLFTVNAAGEIAPPLTLFAYERLPKNCIDKAPNGWGIGKTENGWMTSASFFEYFSNVFYPYLVEKQIAFPVIVFLDGHVSHMSYHLSELCKSKDIILVCLPPNTIHIMQPLDVAFFAPLKKMWNKVTQTWRIHHEGNDLHKFDIPAALADIIKEGNFVKSIQSGFKCCGLYPFDANGFDYEKCLKQHRETSTTNMNDNHTSESNRQYLEMLEKNIDSNILQQFKNLKVNGKVWSGDVKYEALFDTWSKVVDEIDGKVVTKRIEEPVFENSDFSIPDEHVFGGNSNNSEAINESISFIGEINSNIPIEIIDCTNNSSSIDINLFPTANILSDNNDLQKNVDNSHVINRSDLLADQVLTEVNENLSNFEQNLDKFSTLNKNKLNDLTNVQRLCTSDILVTSSNKEETLKNILVYPEITKSSKSKQYTNKNKLPSVITSNRWLELRKKEENKKLLLEQKQKKKAELALKREENLRIKAERKEKREIEKKRKQQEKEKKKEETVSKKLRKTIR